MSTAPGVLGEFLLCNNGMHRIGDEATFMTHIAAIADRFTHVDVDNSPNYNIPSHFDTRRSCVSNLAQYFNVVFAEHLEPNIREFGQS